jgi:predicted membrane-bound spermidine synthase
VLQPQSIVTPLSGADCNDALRFSCHLCTHLQCPAKRVLVVGGGDGGVLRELARHTQLEVRRPSVPACDTVMLSMLSCHNLQGHVAAVAAAFSFTQIIKLLRLNW